MQVPELFGPLSSHVCAVCAAICLNRAHRKLNKEICREVVKELGSIIGHPEICLDHLWLYRGDGLHLSDDGLEVL